MDANAGNASSNTGNVAKKEKFNEEIKVSTISVLIILLIFCKFY